MLLERLDNPTFFKFYFFIFYFLLFWSIKPSVLKGDLKLECDNKLWQVELQVMCNTYLWLLKDLCSVILHCF